MHTAEGKFGKARRTPLSDSTCQALRQYGRKRLQTSSRSSDSPFFINQRSCRLHHCTSIRLSGICRDSAIPIPIKRAQHTIRRPARHRQIRRHSQKPMPIHCDQSRHTAAELILGSRALYDFRHLRTGVRMRPCAYTNGADIICKNDPFISINTAIGIDLFGNVCAGFIGLRKYTAESAASPILFVPSTAANTAPIIAVKSITNKGNQRSCLVIRRCYPHRPSLK